MAQDSQNGMRGALSSKSDYIGGIFDRWINIIPESIIFNKYFLPKALEHAGVNKMVSVYSDFYRYDPKVVGIAPDVIGIKIDDKLIPFVKYDDNRDNKDFWVTQPNCPQIEVKSFKARQYMVSLRDQNYGNKFLVMVDTNLDADYLLPFFDTVVLNTSVLNRLSMPNEFVISNAKNLLSQTQQVSFSNTNLGCLRLLVVTTARDFMNTALELQRGDIPRYFKDVTQRTARGLVKEHLYYPNLPLSHYCQKQASGLYRFNKNWYTLFETPNEKTLDINIENAENLIVVKKTNNAVAVLALEDARINDHPLQKGNQYNINFGTFGSIAGKEYFLNKGLLKYLPNQEYNLIQALADVIN